MKKYAIILHGPPGSGKGTQANLLANKFGLIHFDTGSQIESILYDPTNAKNKTITKYRQSFEKGELLDPKWILKTIKDKAQKIYDAGFGLVFSGSPRTVYEVVGDKENDGLMKLLKNLYGQKNIFIFTIDIPASESIKRNQDRLIEPLLKLPIMGAHFDLKTSPLTGVKLVKRKGLDKPNVIKARLVEYKERTEPVIKALEEIKFKIYRIDGTPLPFKVFESIIKHIK